MIDNHLEMTHTGFKAYDIRGVVPTEINEDLAYRVGRAYAELYHPKTMSIGYDIRPSSLSICEAAIKGLTDGGADVYNIGLCGTEMVYFTTFQYGLDGGFMITASHNPADNNGIKIVREEGIPVSADSGLKDIERLAFSGDFTENKNKGQIYTKNIMEDYIKCLLTFIDVEKLKQLKVVVDAGNGCANICFENLKKHLPFYFIELYMNPDPDFPHGVPNPMLEKCREPLVDTVLKEKADLGIAWDGDFDRCFFIDHKGNFVEGYYMVALLAKYFLQRNEGETIVHDPRVYWCIQKVCNELGGVPVESKGGHAFMKETMRRVKGIYGAENSAHHFFRNFSYCDSGMIPWLIVTQIISETERSLHELIEEMENEYPCSGEINLPVSGVDKILDEVEKKYEREAVEIQHIDGLGMSFSKWRFSLRASNTEPLIRFNMETKGDRNLLKEKQKEVIDFIKNLK